MAFIKYVSPNDYFKDSPVQLVKVARERHTIADKLSFQKRASLFDYDKVVAALKPGDIPIHVVALGCDEYFGPNRNGDAFTKESCRKYHITFVKHAHWFREHNHHDPRKSYGIVKFSAFNERDGRIELIVFLNGTKEAAKRNKGLVADRELELIESGKDLPVSMACKVAYDKCSGCGNEASNRSEYCGPEECVKYGGLKYNIGKTFEDGHTLRAFNPEPKFFDISLVSIPADRIAYTLGVIKTGSANSPSWLYPLPTNNEISKQFRVLKDLCTYERFFAHDSKLASALHPSVYRVKEAAVAIKRLDVPEAVYCLTKSGIILPVEDFLISFAGADEDTAVKCGAAVRPYLKTIFNDLYSQNDIKSLLENNFFYPREVIDKKYIINLDNVSVKKGILSVAPMREPIKLARYVPEREYPDHKLKSLAQTYGLYQLASLSSWPHSIQEVSRRVILMNRS